MNSLGFYKLIEEPSCENGLFRCIKFYYGTLKPKSNKQIDRFYQCFQKKSFFI